MFYHYHQNNSHGRWDKDENLDENVVIEADSRKDADARLEAVGGYFDGRGDCRCCGNRWSRQSEWIDDAEPFPHLYGERVETSRTILDKDLPYIVHYKDGRIVRGGGA